MIADSRFCLTNMHWLCRRSSFSRICVASST